MKCPHCNHNLTIESIIVEELYEDEIYLKLTGYCDHCDGTYVWTECYDLKLKEEKIIQENYKKGLTKIKPCDIIKIH